MFSCLFAKVAVREQHVPHCVCRELLPGAHNVAERTHSHLDHRFVCRAMETFVEIFAEHQMLWPVIVRGK